MRLLAAGWGWGWSFMSIQKWVSPQQANLSRVPEHKESCASFVFKFFSKLFIIDSVTYRLVVSLVDTWLGQYSHSQVLTFSIV